MGFWDGVRDFFLGEEPNVKGATFIPADADSSLGGLLPRTRYSYGRDMRKGLDSNVIMAPVNWICRNFTQAESIVERKMGRTWTEAEDHDLKYLLDRPNDFYTGGLLWKATMLSFLLDGNGYWRKIRNSFGEVIQLWYLPHFLVSPKSPDDGSRYIDHYEYRPSTRLPRPVDIPVRDIVHFRAMALDPRDPRLGLGCLKPLLREIFTDEEAANFSATILRNMGVPGGLISPKDLNLFQVSGGTEASRELKDYIQTEFTGDGRGGWMVMNYPAEVKQFGFDPNSLMLTNLRDITEERVCAMLGVPAAVVGFGAGLQQTKVGATMRELREEAWSSGIEPHQKELAQQASYQIVPDFQSQDRRFRIRFDTSKVPALMERNAALQADMVKAGIQRVDHAQERLGLEVDESQSVYLREGTTVAVPANTKPPAPVQVSDNGASGGVANRLQQMLAGEQNGGGTDE